MNIKLLSFCIILFVSVLFFGCASNYRTINPESVSFNYHNVSEGLSYTYQYDVLINSGNRKYNKKQIRRNINMVAVRITNNTTYSINIAEDLKMKCGDRELVPLQPQQVKKELKQNTLAYLFYMLLTPLKYPLFDKNTEVSIHAGYFIAPAIAGANMATAGYANNRFMEELMEENILVKNIEPGQTIHGLLAFRDRTFDPITIEVRDMEHLAEKQ